jgi:hypothetical protein
VAAQPFAGALAGVGEDGPHQHESDPHLHLLSLFPSPAGLSLP